MYMYIGENHAFEQLSRLAPLANYTDRMFVIKKCVLFIEVSSFQDVLIGGIPL